MNEHLSPAECASLCIIADGTTPLSDLIEQLTAHTLDMPDESARDDTSRESHHDEPPASPQLLPYTDWSKAAHVTDDSTSDLIATGSRGMGISEERLQEILAQASAVRETHAEHAEHAKPEVQGTPANTTLTTLSGSRTPEVAISPSQENQGTADFEDSNPVTGRLTVSDAAHYFEFRPSEDGMILTRVYLRKMSERVGSDNLIIRIPDSVGGDPLTRISADAFLARFTRGVHVRLLVIPDSVEIIGSKAFLPLACEHIYLGRGVHTFVDPQSDLEITSPVLAQRHISVHPANPYFVSQSGCLIERTRTEVLFIDAPYPETLELPPGITRIGAYAFSSGCPLPRIIQAPASLTSVYSRVCDESVWVCPTDTLQEYLHAREVRVARGNLVEEGGCLFEVKEAEATLIAGAPPAPSASLAFSLARAEEGVDKGTTRQFSRAAASVAHTERVHQVTAADIVLPEYVEGLPLTTIGPFALRWAPETLIIPVHVREIAEGNACKGTQRLLLSRNLRRIGTRSFISRELKDDTLIPASVTSIGAGSFEYSIVTLEQTGSIVHVSADVLLSCFIEEPDGANVSDETGEPDRLGESSETVGISEFDSSDEPSKQNSQIPFDYARYDEILLAGKNLPDLIGAYLHRISDPHTPPSKTASALVAKLIECGAEAITRIAQEGDPQLIRALIQAGFVTTETFSPLIEALRQANRAECVILLMQHHHATSDGRSNALLHTNPNESQDTSENSGTLPPDYPSVQNGSTARIVEHQPPLSDEFQDSTAQNAESFAHDDAERRAAPSHKTGRSRARFGL